MAVEHPDKKLDVLRANTSAGRIPLALNADAEALRVTRAEVYGKIARATHPLDLRVTVVADQRPDCFLELRGRQHQKLANRCYTNLRASPPIAGSDDRAEGEGDETTEPACRVEASTLAVNSCVDVESRVDQDRADEGVAVNGARSPTWTSTAT